MLLILTGISVATLTGENGILNKGSKAKLNTEQANILEQLRMAIYAKNLDIESDMENIDYLKSKGIIKEEDINVGKLRKYASINTGIKLSKISVEEENEDEIKYVVDVTKLVSNPSTGNGSLEAGDVYYITNGDLYYMAENQAKTILGNVFYEKITKMDESWFNYVAINDNEMEIIGLNFNNIDYEKTTSLGVYEGDVAIKINTRKLAIPAKIEGKNVVKVSFDNNIASEIIAQDKTIIIQGIKELSYSSTVKELGQSNIIFEDVEKINLQEGLQKISGQCFVGCTKVKEITIPESVKIIGARIVRGWNKDAIIKIKGKDSLEDFTELYKYWKTYKYRMANDYSELEIEYLEK